MFCNTNHGKRYPIGAKSMGFFIARLSPAPAGRSGASPPARVRACCGGGGVVRPAAPSSGLQAGSHRHFLPTAFGLAPLAAPAGGRVWSPASAPAPAVAPCSGVQPPPAPQYWHSIAICRGDVLKSVKKVVCGSVLPAPQICLEYVGYDK